MLKEIIDLTILALIKIAGGGGAGRSGQIKRRKVSRGVAGGDQKVSLLGWVRGEMTAGLGACSCWCWCSTDPPLPRTERKRHNGKPVPLACVFASVLWIYCFSIPLS
ncbi:hypothetical protein NC651_026542 [Populus alba x Populus x berolinensis]|nr:hypothetical protein NC651_026542 [Populus alba x Populus x berolinensis]